MMVSSAIARQSLAIQEAYWLELSVLCPVSQGVDEGSSNQEGSPARALWILHCWGGKWLPGISRL